MVSIVLFSLHFESSKELLFLKVFCCSQAFKKGYMKLLEKGGSITFCETSQRQLACLWSAVLGPRRPGMWSHEWSKSFFTKLLWSPPSLWVGRTNTWWFLSNPPTFSISQKILITNRTHSSGLHEIHIASRAMKWNVVSLEKLLSKKGSWCSESPRSAASHTSELFAESFGRRRRRGAWYLTGVKPMRGRTIKLRLLLKTGVLNLNNLEHVYPLAPANSNKLKRWKH